MHSVGYIGSEGVGTAPPLLMARGHCQLKVHWPDGAPEPLEVLEAQTVALEDLADCPIIVLSTAIANCRSLARRLGDVISGRHIVVHTIRGIEADSLKTGSTILAEETPTRRIGFLTGPMEPQDITDDNPAAALCASQFPEVHQLIGQAMNSERFRLYRSDDLRGAELAAAYGRLISLMSGAADGLHLGTSLQATLFARGLAEMSRFVNALGGDHHTPFGIAGAANLHVDTTEPFHPDFEMGRFLTEAPERGADELRDAFAEPASELLHLLSAFEDVAESKDLALRLLDAVDALLYGELSPTDAVHHLLTLAALDESQ